MVAPTVNNKIPCRGRRPRRPENKLIFVFKNQPVGEGLAPPETNGYRV